MAEYLSGTSNDTVRGVVLFLTEDEAAMVHRAVYLAHGNDEEACPFWEKFRRSCGDEMWLRIINPFASRKERDDG